MLANKYGWFVGKKVEEEAIYYNGSSPGFSSYLGYFPQKDLVVIVLGNNDIALATTIGEGLAAMVMGKELKDFDDLQPIPIDEEFISKVVGRYKFPYSTFEILERDGMLVYKGGYPDYEVPFIPLSNEKLLNRFFWGNLVVERDEKGQALRVYWEGSTQQKGERIQN